MIKVSVVIPAYNAQRTIKSLLDSLVSQNFPQKDYEIIVVDDGSRENLKFKIENLKLQPRIKNLVFLRQKHQGAGRARNFGVKKARGEILVFVDSDCLVPKDWLKNHCFEHQNKNSMVIGGGVKKPKNGDYLAWADFLCSWHNAHEDLGKHQLEYVPSLNLSVKKKDFSKIGGFWEKKLTGEDVDFCLRARQRGIKILFIPRLALWHQMPSLIRFFKHNFRWGYHAPFVRGSQPGLRFHFLFSGGFLRAIFCFFPIVFGWILFLASEWWRYQPLRFIFCSPLIFLGRLTYGFGFLAGSWRKFNLGG